MTEDCVPCQCQGTVDDDFLAEGGGDDVKSSAEGSKDIAVDQAADRVEPSSFPR